MKTIICKKVFIGLILLFIFSACSQLKVSVEKSLFFEFERRLYYDGDEQKVEYITASGKNYYHYFETRFHNVSKDTIYVNLDNAILFVGSSQLKLNVCTENEKRINSARYCVIPPNHRSDLTFHAYADKSMLNTKGINMYKDFFFKFESYVSRLNENAELRIMYFSEKQEWILLSVRLKDFQGLNEAMEIDSFTNKCYPSN